MIIQLKENNCGEIVTRNIINNVYKSKNYACNQLKNECENLQQIKESLNEYGIIVEGYFVEDFRSFYNSKKRIKFITNLIIEKKSHFVICEKINNHLIKIFYPEYGNKIIRISKFIKMFSFNILIIEKIEKNDVKKLKIISKKDITSLVIISLFESISSLLFFILFNNEKFKFFSLLILPFLGVLILCHYSFILNLSNKINKKLVIPYLKENPLNKAFKEVTEVKNSFIEYYNNFICLICLSIFLITYLSLFSLDKLILYLVCFISGFIIDFCFRKIMYNKEKNIEYKENEIFKNNIFNVKLFNDINSYSNKYVCIGKLKQLIIIFIIGVFVLFTMIKNNQIEVFNMLAETTFISLILFYFINLTNKLSKYNDPYSKFILLDRCVYKNKELFV